MIVPCNSLPKKLTSPAENYFHGNFSYLALGLIVGGFIALSTHVFVAAILIMVGLGIITAKEGTEVDLAAKTYREYTSYVFIKRGKFERYKEIEKIFINSGKVSQKVYTAHTLASNTFINNEYRAYLKFESGEKILLSKKRNKAALLQYMDRIAAEIGTELVDTTV